MPIISLNKEFVEKILTGKKLQITQKDNSIMFYPGSVLYLYCNVRQKKSCDNCIVPIRNYIENGSYNECNCYDGFGYTNHENLIGKAEITGVKTVCFKKKTYSEIYDWAKDEGFNYVLEGSRWLGQMYGLNWMSKKYVVLTFKPLWSINKIENTDTETEDLWNCESCHKRQEYKAEHGKEIIM